MYTCGPLHMDKQSLDQQLEPIYNSSVPIQGVAWKTPENDGQKGRVARKGQGEPF